ncbi:TetR/AcrR family transcriptional regulator [Deinococcus pimensis]|uniref:TetR/AcrR family transcriptional regulator n=1 Tax=Deinococcus pimensis TaxID=309888 RepID=UPI0004808D2E|nr:helix-turn-helix domain-containing protein [Deinococcus pimensis]
MTAAEPRKRLPSADRRRQILDAGARLFVERGFEAVTMGDIAAALGTSRPTIYSYFTSPEGILDALLDERLHLLLARLEPLLTPAAGQGDVPNVIEPVFDLLLRERDTLALLHSGGGPSFRKRQHDFHDEVARRLPLGSDHPGRAHPTVLLVVTTLLSSLAYRAATDPAVDAAGLARTLRALVRGGVREVLGHDDARSG